MALRLFAALDIPGDVAERLTALQVGIDGARWRPRENLHITLRFFGDVPENVAADLDAALDEKAAGVPPFELQLKGAGAFGGAHPHALWIGVAENPELKRLAADCERAARRVGLPPEGRKFTPHVTLASVQAADPERVRAFEQRCALFQSRPWQVDRFALLSSRVRPGAPSLYRAEAEYPLLG